MANDQATPQPGMSADETKAFRRCLGQFATGVTVVTARSAAGPVGMTANSFSSVSLDPPLILWSISRRSKGAVHFAAATHFAVNILAAQQVDIALRFAQSGIDRFAGVDWHEGRNGAPVITGAAAQIECAQAAQYDGGDHIIIIGRVERFVHTPADALVFAQGQFAVTAMHPQLQGRTEPAAAATADDAGTPLMTLLYRAHRQLADEFQAIRSAAGLEWSESRVLFGIADHPDADRTQIARYTLLGDNALEDAIGRLRKRGAAEESPDGRMRLTRAGETLLADLKSRMVALEQRFVARATAGRLAALRGSLIEIASEGGTGARSFV